MSDDVYARALARLKAPFISSKPMSVAMAEELGDMKPLLCALLEERERRYPPGTVMESEVDELLLKFAGGE